MINAGFNRARGAQVSPDEFREIINSVLDDRNRIDAETHETHHQWVRNRIECDVRRRAIVDGTVKTVLGATGILALAWLGAKILEALRMT